MDRLYVLTVNFMTYVLRNESESFLSCNVSLLARLPKKYLHPLRHDQLFEQLHSGKLLFILEKSNVGLLALESAMLNTWYHISRMLTPLQHDQLLLTSFTCKVHWANSLVIGDWIDARVGLSTL